MRVEREVIELQTTPLERTENMDLARVRMLAHFLDSAFEVPGTKFRIGADAIMGLVPILGDALGAVFGTYILYTSARMGVPKVVLARMIANIGADAVLGALPIVGDIADAAWRANAKNARLLEAAMAHPLETRRSSKWLLIGLAAVVFGMAAAGIAASIWVVRLLLGY